MRLLLPFILLLTSCRDDTSADSSGSSTADSEPPLRVESTRPLMGTLFKIITHTTDREPARLDMEAAFDLAEDFANRATDYNPDSELNRLTRSTIGTPVKVSPHLFKVLLLGQKIAQQTNGLFDPTYGPLTHLWRETSRTGRKPPPDEITAARARCGIQHLTFNEENQTITIGLANMQLDLGGVAKGYAADLIFDHLREKGYPQTLVAAAGDLRIGDPPPDQEGWNIGLRTFSLTPSDPISLKNCAISTSGDLFQRVTLGDQTHSHLIDPKTGLGLTTRRAASVILPEAQLTDPLATAACLSDTPLELFKAYSNASIRVIYHDKKIPPVITGVFAE